MKAAEIPRTERLPISPSRHPKLHPPGALKVGDSVWYRKQRYWLEWVPKSWEDGTAVRISDTPIRPEAAAPLSRTSFAVYADLVTLAPVSRNKYASQPTLKAIETKARQKIDGTTDNGDEVAVLLRDSKSLDDAYRIAAKYLKMKEPELRARYEHLNFGQQRMCCGNLMRAAQKKGVKK